MVLDGSVVFAGEGVVTWAKPKGMGIKFTTLDPATAKEKYGWKLFTATVNSLTPGEHTLVSRAIDVTGKIQPTAQELENKKSFLEDNSQTVRKIKI